MPGRISGCDHDFYRRAWEYFARGGDSQLIRVQKMLNRRYSTLLAGFSPKFGHHVRPPLNIHDSRA